MSAAHRRWNLNIHYHRVFLDVVPAGARTALDVGCGDGLLSFELAGRGLDVVGIDPDGPSIERARSDPRSNERTKFFEVDVFEFDLPPASYDLVVANAMLHHVDATAGLRRLRELVKPGGVVAVVGFANADGVKDQVLAVAGATARKLRELRGDYWEHNAPILWPPPMTTSEMRELGRAELPGSTFRRLMSNRFSLVWRAPGRLTHACRATPSDLQRGVPPCRLRPR